MDKETLIKNRFWVLLGLFVPLELFAIIWLESAVQGSVEDKRQKIEKHREELKKHAEQAKLNGQKEMDLCKHKIEQLNVRKEEVWKEAWDLQQGLMFWPDKVKDAYADRYFGDPVNDSVRTTYAQRDVYLAQYEAMAKTFQAQVPMTDRKTGKRLMRTIDPVAFAGSWQKVLHPIEKWPLLPPTDEEVWLAQEDVWVRHELLGALKKANTSVARFELRAGKGGEAGAALEQTFENPYWRIALSLYPKDQQYYFKGKITNIGKKRLALGQAYFWLQVQRDEKEPRVVLRIEGEARAAGESWDIKETMLDLALNPAGLFGLEQILEPRTVPVRRIDDIVLCYHSHRTYDPILQQARQFGGAKPKKPEPSANPLAPTTPTLIKPRTEADSKTPNGLVRDRYADETAQVRRMPLALVVIADQAHIPEVLTALSNCQLRMQVTQVNWQHFRGTLETEEPAPAAKDPKGLGAPRAPIDAKAHAEESQKELVELSVYGIVSLYERPGKKEPAAPNAKKGKD